MLEVYHLMTSVQGRRLSYTGGTFALRPVADHAVRADRIRAATDRIRRDASISGKVTRQEAGQWLPREHDWLVRRYPELQELLEEEDDDLAIDDETSTALGFDLWLNSFWRDCAEGKR